MRARLPANIVLASVVSWLADMVAGVFAGDDAKRALLATAVVCES